MLTRPRNKCALFFLLLILPFGIWAQSPGDVENLSLSHTHLRFGALALLCNKARYHSISGEYQIGSNLQLGYEIDVNLVVPINLSWNFVTGAELGVIGWTYLLRLPAYALDSSQNYPFIDNGAATRMKDIFFLRVPILFESKWKGSDRYKSWLVNFGPYIGFGLNGEGGSFDGYNYNYTTNDLQKYLSFNTSLNNAGKPWLGFQAAFGMIWTLKNRNYLSAKITCTVSNAKVGQGNYAIYTANGEVSKGTIAVKDQLVSFGVSYELTGVRKMAKREQISL